MEDFMDRARSHEGIRRMRFTDVLGRSERAELSQMEAAQVVGRLERTIRRMRCTDVLGSSERSELSQMEAAELLGISERTFRRCRDRHRDDGQAGLADRRLSTSPRRASVAEIERMLGLYRDLYRG